MKRRGNCYAAALRAFLGGHLQPTNLIMMPPIPDLLPIYVCVQRDPATAEKTGRAVLQTQHVLPSSLALRIKIFESAGELI
jgi:hypothetical protein